MKELHCAEVGFDCQETISGESEEEVMAKAADHARDAHGLAEINEPTGQKIRAQIHEAA
jgi:predicted small metal-binding protein